MSALRFVVLAGVVLACGPALAQDPPAAPAPSWKGLVQGAIAVSRDGSWIAFAGGGKSVKLCPAAGGTPVTLDLDKSDDYGFRCEFTADSKWLVVPASAERVQSSHGDRDDTQSVYVFPTSPDGKRRTLQFQLKPEPLNKDLPQLGGAAGTLRKMKGVVDDLVPLTGSRMLFDRTGIGVETWDVAAGGKFAAPPALDARFACGLSADGARCVRTAKDGLEIADVRRNQVQLAIKAPAAKGVVRWYPIFAQDGASVLVIEETFGTGRKGQYAVECWSATDGKSLWKTPVGEGERHDAFCSAGGYAAIAHSDGLRLLDLRDGKEVAHALAGRKIGKAVPTADGKALWVNVARDLVTRMDLPPLPAR